VNYRPTVVFVMLLFFIGCVSDEDLTTIDTWLLCDDCIELQSEVADMGLGAVPLLADALSGPSPGNIERFRRQFTELYRMIPPGAGLAESDYVNLHLGNLRASYHKRAAASLGDIARGCLSLICKRLAVKALTLSLERDSIVQAQTGSAFFRSDVARSIQAEIVRAGVPGPVLFLWTP